MQRIPKRLVEGSQLTTGAEAYYTVPVNTSTTIAAATITNTSAGAVTATVYLVPAAGLPTASNTVLAARVIAAGESYNIGSVIAQTLHAGATIQALASVGAAVNLVASGYETT